MQHQSLVESKGDALYREGPMGRVRVAQSLTRSQSQGEGGVSLTYDSPVLSCGQGGITLGREQGEVGAYFPDLGTRLTT